MLSKASTTKPPSQHNAPILALLTLDKSQKTKPELAPILLLNLQLFQGTPSSCRTNLVMQQTRNTTNFPRNQTIKVKENKSISKFDVRLLMPSEKAVQMSTRQSEKFFSTFSSFKIGENLKPKHESRLPSLKLKDKSANPSFSHKPSHLFSHPPLISNSQKAPLTSRDISYMLDQERKEIGLKMSHSLERKKLLSTIGVEEDSGWLDHLPNSFSALMDTRLRIKEELLNSLSGNKFRLFFKKDIFKDFFESTKRCRREKSAGSQQKDIGTEFQEKMQTSHKQLSGLPSSRHEAVALLDWFDKMKESLERVEDSEAKSELAQVLFFMTYRELIKQVSVHCVERGVLLWRLWKAYFQIVEYLRVEYKRKKDSFIKQHENKIYNLHLYYDEEITELHKQFEETKNKYENVLKQLKEECKQLKQERDKANAESTKAIKRNEYLNSRLQEYEPYRDKYRNAKLIAQKLRNQLIQVSEDNTNSTVAFLRAQRLSALEEASQFTRKYSQADEMKILVDQESQTDENVAGSIELKIEPPSSLLHDSEISKTQNVEVKDTDGREKPVVEISTVIPYKHFNNIGINTEIMENEDDIESEDSQDLEEIKIMPPQTESDLNQSIESKPVVNPRNEPLSKNIKKKKDLSKKPNKSKNFQKVESLIPKRNKPSRPLTPAVYSNRQKNENKISPSELVIPPLAKSGSSNLSEKSHKSSSKKEPQSKIQKISEVENNEIKELKEENKELTNINIQLQKDISEIKLNISKLSAQLNSKMMENSSLNATISEMKAQQQKLALPQSTETIPHIELIDSSLSESGLAYSAFNTPFAGSTTNKRNAKPENKTLNSDSLKRNEDKIEDILPIEKIPPKIYKNKSFEKKSKQPGPASPYSRELLIQSPKTCCDRTQKQKSRLSFFAQQTYSEAGSPKYQQAIPKQFTEALGEKAIIRHFQFAEFKLGRRVNYKRESAIKNLQLPAIQDVGNIPAFPLKMLLRIISQIYHLRIQAKSGTQKELNLPAFLYGEILNRYGLKTVADKKLLQIMAGCLLYKNILRIRMFGRFLGLYEEYSRDEFNCCIEIIEFVRALNVGFNVESQEYDEKNLIPLIKGKEVLRSYFESKLPPLEFAELQRRLDSLQIFEVRLRIPFAIIEIDTLIELVLNEFRRLTRKAEELLEDLFIAADIDLDGLINQEEFEILIFVMEKNSYTSEQTLKLFSDYADYILEGTQYLSFEKFSSLAAKHSLFSEQTQCGFLGIQFVTENISLILEEIKKNIDSIFETFKSRLIVSQIWSDKWKERLEGLRLRLFHGEYSSKSLLLNYRILQKYTRATLEQFELCRLFPQSFQFLCKQIQYYMDY